MTKYKNRYLYAHVLYRYKLQTCACDYRSQDLTKVDWLNTSPNQGWKYQRKTHPVEASQMSRNMEKLVRVVVDLNNFKTRCPLDENGIDDLLDDATWFRQKVLDAVVVPWGAWVMVVVK